MRRIRRATVAFAVLALGLTALLAGGSVAQAAGTLTFTASGDSYATAGFPDTPQGTQDKLRANNGNPDKISYVQFTVSGVPSGASVSSATLTLTGYNVTQPSQTVTVYSMPSTWDEATVTYNNRPTLGAQVGTGTMSQNGVVNVAVPVSGNGTVSYAVKAATTSDAVMASRENTTVTARPKLAVSYTDPPPPPPAFPAGTWVMNCFDQPYAFAQTTSPNGVINRRFEVRQGDQWSSDVTLHNDGRQRCEEKNKDTFWNWNTDVWMAEDFQWSGAVPTGTHHNIINQFQQIEEPCDTGGGHPPSLSLGFRDGNFDVSTHATTQACDTTQPPNVTRYSQSWFPANTWERIVLHTRMNPNGTGVIDLWLNGTKVYTGTNLAIGYAVSTDILSNYPHYSDGEYRDAQTQTTVFQIANLQLGTADLSARISNPPPLPN